MNIFSKVSLVSCVAMVMTTIAGCSGSPSSMLLPLAEVTAQTSQRIANDLHYEMALAKSAPRATPTIRTSSVEVSEMAEVIVVEASRLPVAEHFADAAAAQPIAAAY
jgi:sulfite reductase alpha subunit-like flavoprotein